MIYDIFAERYTKCQGNDHTLPFMSDQNQHLKKNYCLVKDVYLHIQKQNKYISKSCIRNQLTGALRDELA